MSHNREIIVLWVWRRLVTGYHEQAYEFASFHQLAQFLIAMEPTTFETIIAIEVE